MNLTELLVSLTVTVGTAGVAATALDAPTLIAHTTAVSGQATCRTLDTAIVAYAAEHDAPPVQVADVRPYLRDDVAGYQIIDGVATGPGCPAGPTH